MRRDQLAPELVGGFLDYEPHTGLLRWRDRAEYTPSVRARLVGKVAGHLNAAGYVVVKVAGVLYPAHHLAWAITWREWPENEIDHINGERADNRLLNLRLATRLQNMANVGAYCTNTSGYKGVSYDRRSGKWRAQITFARRTRNLGRFDTADEAYAAYCEVARGLHGEFARAA